MAFTCEGTLEIDLADFWEWVYENYSPVPKGSEIQYGVPRVNKSNGVLEIDFAASSDNSPETWAIQPDAVKQWKN